MRCWARVSAAASLGASYCASAVVESVMLLAPSLLLVGGFHSTAHCFIRDAVVLCNLAERFALFSAAEHIRPLFGGNTVMRVSRAGASLFAGLGRFGDKKKGPLSACIVCHGI